MGDPAGIGPELCLRILREPAVLQLCRPLVVGDLEVLRQVASAARLVLPECVVPVEAWEQGHETTGPTLVDLHLLNGKQVQPGRIHETCGKAAYEYIRLAVKAAMEKRVAAMVTAPINKAALKLAGLPYPGHTEMIAEMTGTRRFCMMLASDILTVSLATIHMACGDVPGRLTKDGILDVIRLTGQALKHGGRSNPRLTVCGLNPHGGENGLFGTEEGAVIEPAISQARAEGYQITGPLPPDTAFVPIRRAQTDAYIAMYHDQGLIPFKMLAFEKGVNVTLGLPIVRTSPDHGTAFDIAWQGKASATSMIEAVKWAVRLAAAGGQP